MAVVPGILQVRDANGVTQNINVDVNGAGYFTYHMALELAGVDVGTSNPLPTQTAGSVGADSSANKPSAIPPAGWFTLTTIAVNPARCRITVQNQSTDIIWAVRDDGTGNNVSVFILNAALSGGEGGGIFDSTTFKGRLTVYAPTSTDQVSAYQD